MGNNCFLPKETNTFPFKELDDLKILLVGSGESGKSTLYKQLRLISGEEFSELDRISYKSIIQANIVTGIKALVLATQTLNFPIENELNRQIAQKIKEIDMDFVLKIEKNYTAELAKEIETLWKDPSIQKAYEHRSSFQLVDNTEYFLENIKLYSDSQYVPTEKDILKCRLKTTGISEMDIKLNSKNLHVIDVGGQRAERKKWIHYFDNVNAVLFVASLSEYDLTCYEDSSTNRLEESLKLFDEISNSRYFNNIPIILILNKSDIFKEKLKKKNLGDYIKSYEGGDDVEQALKHIQELFIEKVFESNDRVTTHVISALDTDTVSVAFEKIINTVKYQKKK